MNVIVSSVLNKNMYSRYTVVDNLRSVQDITEPIEILILHRSASENDFKLGAALSDITKKPIKYFLYINSEPSTMISTLIQGVGGRCFTDEFYFDDEEDLDALVEDVVSGIEESTELAVSANADIIQDFIDSFARNDKRIQAPAYLEQVKQAVTDLNVQLDNYALATEDMGTKVLSVFNQVSTLVKRHDELNDRLKVLGQKLKDMGMKDTKSHGGLDGNISVFPQYTYFGSAKTVLFREVSPCRYLTSFALGYYHYLKNVKNKRVKLIFIAPKFKLVADKYREYTSITSESCKNDSLFLQDILYVNHPMRDVMDKVFGKTVSDPRDVYIIVDRLYGTTPIFNSTIGFAKISAASGSMDIKRYNLKLDDTIFSVSQVKNAFYNIPTYSGYPNEILARQAIYLQNQREVYEKIDKRIML